jgi:hypothetical protein
MQALLNRTSEITESAYGAALNALYLGSFFGFSYIAMSMVTSFLARMMPSASRK